MDIGDIRAEFPALQQSVHGYPLAYLDSASTALVPRSVIEVVQQYYERDCANVHRGVHTLSQRATERFERTRETAASFLGGVDPEEVVFTRGTTESVNLIASTLGRERVKAGDEILVSEMEHHSNLVPWMRLCEEVGARLRVWPLTDEGELSVEALPQLIGPRTKIAAVSHVSNVLGSTAPVQILSELLHPFGGLVVVDGAQAVSHLPIDVQALGADFYVFSGHKVYGPTGAGVLWGRAMYLESMSPWQGGGEMVVSVSFQDGIEYSELPHRFEAGTPDIAAVIGMGAALGWVQQVGFPWIQAHEGRLHRLACQLISEVKGVRWLANSEGDGPIQSFVLEGVHPHDAGTILDRLGIAVRTGHHCAQPVMHRYGVEAAVRSSLAVYNTEPEVERLAEGLKKVLRTFSL